VNVFYSRLFAELRFNITHWIKQSTKPFLICQKLLKHFVAVPRSRKFFLKFLGSIEVSYHRGNDVLCQAINKVCLSDVHCVSCYSQSGLLTICMHLSVFLTTNNLFQKTVNASANNMFTGHPSVRCLCPLTPISRDAISLYLVKRAP